MKRVCFLNGHLILRSHKTGVHYFHEYITKIISTLPKSYELNVAYFDHKNKYSNFLSKDVNKWLIPYVNVCKKYPRILSYILPIELFFKKNDLYFCDGLMPHTFFKSKKVCLVHDMMVKIYPENYTLIKKLYLNLFFRNLKKADLVISVSENTKKDIIRFYHIDPKKIVVCYNGIDKREANIPHNPTNKFIDKESEFFLYIGDMRKNKNLINTVKGFLKFCELNPNSHTLFYVAGKQNGDYENLVQLLKESKFANRVVFLGYVTDDDKNYLYANCKAVILLSEYEGFGMPIIEGMSFMKPVITSNCSSMREVGENAAILVDPFNISEISEAMTDVDNGSYKIDANEYKKKLDKFSFDNVAKIINREVEKLLNE